MSKTDKENKENKDIINLMVLNKDFSYNKTEYYLISSFSSTQYTSEIHKYYKNEYNQLVFERETPTVKQDIGIYIPSENSIQTDGQQDNKGLDELSTQEKEELVIELFETNDIINKLDVYLEDFRKFIENLSKDSIISDYRFLETIYVHANERIKLIKSQLNSELENLQTLDDSLVRNIIYQELVNIIKDMLLDFLSGKIEKLFRRSLELLLRFAGCTFFGILFIIYELLMIGMSIYEKYKKYKDAKEGFIIGKKFYALYIFYNYLDVNLAYIITENNTDNVLFTKTKDEENDLYFIDMYTFTNKLTLLSNLEYYSGLNYIDRRFKVTFRADSDLFNNSIFSLDNIIQENSGIYKNKNSCVQLSTYNGVVDICDSSYYNHIKSLIFNADKFTFIQTSNYCSLVIDKFIKTSYKLSDSEIIDNKYSIIISNKAAQNDLRYRIQSEINWKQKEHISKNLVFFSIKNNYKISSFFNYYCQFIRDFTLKLEKCLNEIMNFNEDDIKLIYLYIIYYDLFCSEIFNYRSFLGIIGGDLVSNILYFFDIEETDDAVKRFNKRDKSIDSIIKICDTFFTKFNKCCSEKIKDTEYTVDDILLFLQKPHKVLETINKKENNQVVKTFFEIFSELYLFMVDLNSIASYFYNTNISAEDSIKLYNAKKMFKEEVRAFFKRDLEKDAKINTFTILFKSVKLDKVLHAIYMQVIDVLYSKSFVDDKENFIKNLMKYICGDSDSDSVIVNMHYKPLSDIIDDYLMIYEKFAIKFNTYSTCSIPITLYQINKTFAKEIIYTMIYDEVSDMFPISRNNFDYILYDKKYYILLSEYIYYKHLMENPEYFNIITLRFATKITEYVNKIASNNITDLYNFYYILIMYVHCFIGNINVFDNCVHETIKIFKDELLKFNKKVLDKFDDLVHDSIIYCLFNDYNIEFSIKDIYDLSSTERKVLTLIISSIIESLSVVSSPITEVFNMANITKNTMLKSMEFFRNGVSIYSEHINNNPNERRDVAMFLQSNRNAFKNTFITLYNDGKQLLKNNWHDFKANFMQVLRQHTHQERSMDFTINFGENFRNLRSLYSNGMLAMCSRESNITLTSSIRIHDNESLNAVSVRYIRESLFNVGSRLSGSNISDNNTNSYNINHILLDSDGVSNMFEQHINLMNTYLQNYTNNNMRLSETTHLDVSNIDNINQASATLRDRSVLVGITSNNETHVYNGRHIDGSAHFSSTVSVETNRNEQKFAKQLFGLGLNFIADTVIETYVFDVFFSIIDKKEYESKLYAIKYAYVNKISNIHGAEWNINHDYFTLPKQINQNFIMSDFRAMVVGGAHFDNSCFIKGTSSGIFVQDNEKVTRSFLEIILDYIDVVEEQQLNVKMGKYLVAYYKVINYLYEFHNYYSMSLDKLNILYDNLSRIEEFINSENLIQKKNGVDNENTQKINNNDSQYMDNLLMKDFVVQLKRIGESNYKFYETQKPGKEGQASNNNDNSKEGDVQQAQPEQDNGTATDTTTIKSDNNSSVERMVMQISSFEDDEIPVLLGSLIYDEHWFKSTIDDE